MGKLKLAILLLCILIGSIVAGAIIKQYTIPTTGTVGVSTLQIYIDKTLWDGVTPLNWGGNLEPGATYVANFTVVNNGTIPVQVIHSTQRLPAYLTQTWTRNGTILEPSQAAIGYLYLTIALDAPQASFSYDTIISLNTLET